MTSEEKIANAVDLYGWHIINVFEGKSNYQFSYTIGLYKTFNAPELFISGLSGEVGSTILNNIAEDIKQGRKITSGMESGAYIKGYNCYFGLIDKLHYKDFFRKALWYYGGDSFPIMQCVWPNKDHEYPWNVGAGFNQDILV